MRIFPGLYQKVFQTSTVAVHNRNSHNSAAAGSFTTVTASFDTDSMLKSIQNEIKTYEQYEKFLGK
jgi:hypothetical protein